MTIYTKTNVLFQADEQADYSKAIPHANEYTLATGNAQAVQQVVGVGTGWTAISMAHLALSEILVVENEDTVNAMYLQCEVLKNSTTYGATVAFVDSDPDTITDSGSAFVTNLYSVGDVLVVTGSASNNGSFTIQAVVAGTVTLIESDTVVVEAAGATPLIKCYGKCHQVIPAGGSVVLAGANWANATSLQLACPSGATTAKLSYIGTKA